MRYGFRAHTRRFRLDCHADSGDSPAMLKPSPATVVAIISLFMATAGTATAVTLVTSKNVKNNSLTGKDVKNRSLTGKDIKAGSIGAGQLAAGVVGQAGAKGDTGDKGDKGDPGATGTPDTSNFYDRATSDERFQARYRTTQIVRADGTPVENGARLLDVLQATAPGTSVAGARLILLEPGHFDVGSTPVEMKRFVDLAGSGAGITLIEGNGDETLRGAADASLRDVKVLNDGVVSIARGVTSNAEGFRIDDAVIEVADGNVAMGLYVSGGDTTATDTRVSAASADTAYGIRSAGTFRGTDLDVEADAAYQNYAVAALDASTTISDSRLVAPDAVFEAAVTAEGDLNPVVRVATSELDSPTPATGAKCVMSWRADTLAALNGNCA